MKRALYFDWKLNLTYFLWQKWMPLQTKANTAKRAAGLPRTELDTWYSSLILQLLSRCNISSKIWLSSICFLITHLHWRCANCTYFPWGNWDEREALQHCTCWWVEESHPCPSCTVLCHLCCETWSCQSPTDHTPWWPTQATGAHGPGTTMTGLQEIRRELHNCFWTDSSGKLGEAHIW